MVDVEGHLLGSDPSISQDVLVKTGTRTNISKRESDLKDARVARKIAHATLLPRDRQLMDSLCMGDLRDQSVVNAIRVSFLIISSTKDELSFIYDLD